MARFPKPLKIFLFVLGGVAGVLLLAALYVMLFVDANDYKPRIEEAASRRFGMAVTVEGDVRIGLLPGLNVTLEKVRIINRGIELAFLEEAALAIEVLPLIHKEIHYKSIELNRARISIERARDGSYNYQKIPGVIGIFRGIDLAQISFTDLVVPYTDKQFGSALEFRGCNGDLNNMQHPGGAPFLSRLSLAGKFTCSEVRGKSAKATDFKFSVEATDGIFDFKPVTMQLFGAQGSGTMHMDRTGAVPVIHLTYSLPKFHIEQFFKTTPSGKSVTGLMDFSTTLTMRGKNRVELRKSAMGEMSLSGKNLTLGGIDLDQALRKYESSQNFNLVDVAALLFAGPVGLAVTKGFEFSTLAQKSDGSTPIDTVISKWKVEKGVAYAKDVAMATPENRLALHGGLDFVDDEYKDVVIAVIDSNGCAKLRQNVHGPFKKPVVEKTDVLTVVTGPVRKLLNKAKEAISGPGEKCEAFYSGSVAPPK